tara:strand:+ start:5271 stop:5609 length:339 start_codon:yes stop_codon:yes gene_type:complete
VTTVEIQTNPGRIDAVRHLSDQAVSTRATALAFQVEALTEAGPFGVPPGAAPKALEIARQLEELAGETAAERPAIARTLRTAAADLRRAAEASGPRDAFSALSDALALLEQL